MTNSVILQRYENELFVRFCVNHDLIAKLQILFSSSNTFSAPSLSFLYQRNLNIYFLIPFYKFLNIFNEFIFRHNNFINAFTSLDLMIRLTIFIFPLLDLSYTQHNNNSRKDAVLPRSKMLCTHTLIFDWRARNSEFCPSQFPVSVFVKYYEIVKANFRICSSQVY